MANCIVLTTNQINTENGEVYSDSHEGISLLAESDNLTDVECKVEEDDHFVDGSSSFRTETLYDLSSTKSNLLTKLGKFHECIGPVELCPQLQAILPPGYSYVVCNVLPFEMFDGEERFSSVLRIALSTAEQAEQWLCDFQSSSKTTWRVDKTYPDPQTKVIFKKDYHCQHNTRSTSHKDRNIQNSHKKNTNCPAKLTITVKKFPKNTKSEDPHAKTHATLVSLKQTHNHKVLIGDALRHRPVSDDVRARFINFFRLGLTPPQALARHQLTLREQFGDGYDEAVIDRHLCPDIHWCYRLYYKLFRTKNGVSDTLQDNDTIESRACEVETMLRRLTDGLCRKLRQKPATFVPVVEKLLLVSQSLLDNSQLETDAVTDDADVTVSTAEPRNASVRPTEAAGSLRVVGNVRFHKNASLPRKRKRAKLTHAKEHDYSSSQPTENDASADSKSFMQSILIPASYGSVVLSRDVNLSTLPESWGIAFGPHGDLQTNATRFETNQSTQESLTTTQASPDDAVDPSKESMMDVSMQYEVDQVPMQTFHFISDNNPRINVIHVNANQNDVSSVADLKELLRCF